MGAEGAQKNHNGVPQPVCQQCRKHLPLLGDGTWEILLMPFTKRNRRNLSDVNGLGLLCSRQCVSVWMGRMLK